MNDLRPPRPSGPELDIESCRSKHSKIIGMRLDSFCHPVAERWANEQKCESKNSHMSTGLSAHGGLFLFHCCFHYIILMIMSMLSCYSLFSVVGVSSLQWLPCHCSAGVVYVNDQVQAIFGEGLSARASLVLVDIGSSCFSFDYEATLEPWSPRQLFIFDFSIDYSFWNAQWDLW